MASISKDLPRTLSDLVEFDWEAGKDVEVTCPGCQGTFMHNEHLNRVFKDTHCDDCCEEHMIKQVKQELNVVAAIERARLTIPPRYQNTDLERLPWPQRQEVLAWDGKPKGQGLWLMGDTRTGKTRTLCKLLEKLIEDGQEVMAFFHGAFGDDLLEVMRSERSYKAWKRKVTGSPILVIDDLFSNKMTERSESALFEILDERIAWFRPTFVTTQVTAKDAKAKFHSQHRGQAFFARVKEFFKVHAFTVDKQEAMKV